ncbi:MAG: hypothetical protein KAR21_08825, partial [Spirochaetales bacterium]|nr:hypothetical protein [Spirochaetales bacterium]
MVKRSVALFLVLVLAFLVLPGLVWAAGEKEPVVEESSGEPVDIVFWYAISGSKGEVFKGLIDKFNSTQDEVIVEGIFS